MVLSLLLLIRWPRLASAFLFLAALESLAGMGTAAAEMAGLTPVSLFPADSSYDDNGSRYTWHPLLQAVPIRSTTFAEGTVHHNSLGMRGPEQTPESLSGKALIALFVDANEAHRLSGPELFVSPLFAVSTRLIILAFDTVRPVRPWGRGKISGEPDTRLESLYARNVETISAINRQRGIKTIWIGQLLDPTRLTGDVPDKWVVLVPPRRTWPLVQRLNRILEESAKQLGDTYVFPSTTFGHEDFVDMGHFSESGAIKFARAVVEPIRASCH